MTSWWPLGRHVLSRDEFVKHTTGFLTAQARRDLVDSAWTAVRCPGIDAMAR